MTDCLTSIHYIFNRAIGVDIPLAYIGDMPRHLFVKSEWKSLMVPIEEIQCGDLLFVKNRENEKLLSHIALVMEVDRIFHCCPKFGTAVIQSNEDFFSLYEQRLNFKKMIRYIDPRNVKLREEQGGIYIA